MFFTKKKDALPVPIQDDYEIINEKNKIPLGVNNLPLVIKWDYSKKQHLIIFRHRLEDNPYLNNNTITEMLIDNLLFLNKHEEHQNLCFGVDLLKVTFNMELPFFHRVLTNIENYHAFIDEVERKAIGEVRLDQNSNIQSEKPEIFLFVADMDSIMEKNPTAEINVWTNLWSIAEQYPNIHLIILVGMKQNIPKDILHNSMSLLVGGSISSEDQGYFFGRELTTINQEEKCNMCITQTEFGLEQFFPFYPDKLRQFLVRGIQTHRGE